MLSVPIVTNKEHILGRLSKLNTKINKPHSDKYSINEVVPGIYYIDNFLTDKELDELLSIIKDSPESDWGKDYIESLEGNALVKFGDKDFRKYVEQDLMFMNEDWLDKSLPIPGNIPKRLSRKVRSLFSDKVSIDPMATIQRHYPGSKLEEHVDAENDPNLAYASVIYLNDDFNGGELYFPNKNVELKPVTKRLMLFDTSSDFRHGVRTVLPGPTRYAMAGFIFAK